MTRPLLAPILIALALSGCASAQKRWKTIMPGQAKNDVIAVMGPPDGFTKEGESHILSWRMDEFEKCAVLIDKGDKVAGKTCKEDTEGRARAEQAAAMMYLQMQSMRPRQPAIQPTQPYHAPRTQQSTCRTTWNGGVATSDCTTNPTGIDTSIYR